MFYYTCRKQSRVALPSVPVVLWHVLKESLCAIVIVLMRLLPPVKARIVADPGSGNGRPVVCCPGYLMDGSSFWFLSRRMRKAGFGPVYRLSYPRQLAPIEELAHLLVADLLQVRRALPGMPITIVAHSMGALVARVALQHESLGAGVARLVTLSAPYHGTHTARLGPGANSRQMVPGSEFLTELNARTTTVPITSLYSRVDFAIFPPETTQVTDGLSIEMPPIGHLAMLLSKRSADCICRSIEDPVL